MALSKEQRDWLSKIKSGKIITKNVPEEFLTEEFCLAAVQEDWQALLYVPEALKTEAVCNAAVGQAGEIALNYVPDNLKTVQLYFSALMYIHVHYRINYHRPLGQVINFVPDELQSEVLRLYHECMQGR